MTCADRGVSEARAHRQERERGVNVKPVRLLIKHYCGDINIFHPGLGPVSSTSPHLNLFPLLGPTSPCGINLVNQSNLILDLAYLKIIILRVWDGFS